MQAKRTLDINDEADVRIHKSFHSLVCDAGGLRTYILSKETQETILVSNDAL